MSQAIRVDRCEHVWAEVMNVRGESMKRTTEKLLAAGYKDEAEMVEAIAEDKDLWEGYARATFLNHALFIDGSKLRFLQYVNASNLSWWKEHEIEGAVLLGKAAHG